MKITIIGTGYVGLCLGTCFATLNNQVLFYDKLVSKIKLLQNNDIPFYEPDLKELFDINVKNNNLKFTNNFSLSIKKADIIFITVETPTNEETGHTDLSNIKEICTKLSKSLSSKDGYKIIIIKSTVSVGTNEVLTNLILENNADLEFDIVSIPEFLREGKAIDDCFNPSRIIIGINSERAKKILQNLYSPFINKNIPILFCSSKSAEMIKYASNSFLGIKVSFINEFADLCEKTGADIRDVSKGIGLDNRIGNQFLSAGPGFGGSCFPKDMLEILTTSKENNATLSIVEACINSNLAHSAKILNKIEKILQNKNNINTVNKKVAIWGLAFKADTDDIRMSPAIPIIKGLQNKKIQISVYDPKAMNNMKKILSTIEYTDSLYSCTIGADAIIIITDWNEFKNINLKKILSTMRNYNIIDLRNILDPNKVIEAGFNYFPIGYNV